MTDNLNMKSRSWIVQTDQASYAFFLVEPVRAVSLFDVFQATEIDWSICVFMYLGWFNYFTSK